MNSEFLKTKGIRGQAILEFALIFPIFMVLMLAIMDYARMFYFQQQLQHAVREAGRAGIVGSTNYGGTVQSTVQQVLYDKSGGLLPSANATITYSNRSNTNSNVGSASDTFTVRVDYAYDFITPLVPLFKATFNSSTTLTNHYDLVASSTFVSEKYNDDF